jgi:hypothetical protein
LRLLFEGDSIGCGGGGRRGIQFWFKRQICFTYFK